MAAASHPSPSAGAPARGQEEGAGQRARTSKGAGGLAAC